MILGLPMLPMQELRKKGGANDMTQHHSSQARVVIFLENSLLRHNTQHRLASLKTAAFHLPMYNVLTNKASLFDSYYLLHLIIA